MGTPSTTGSWWQYSRWNWLIARNSRITNPTGAELTAVQTFLDLIFNPATRTGTRPWLETAFRKKAAKTQAGAASGEPTCNLIEMLGVVGRDMKKIPMTATEKGYLDTLITATGNRRYGAQPYYGSTI